jgi:hypothetical protein
VADPTRLRESMRVVVHAGLAYKDISNASPEMRSIVDATTTALRRIASESPLNAVRVRRYGISLESIAPTDDGSGGVDTKES